MKPPSRHNPTSLSKGFSEAVALKGSFIPKFPWLEGEIWGNSYKERLFIYIRSGYYECHRSYTGGKIKCKAKHVQEDRIQDLASLRIAVKEVYIHIFTGIKCMSYEKPRRLPAGLRHILP